ncbi:MAG: hypothetical protein AABX71_00445 [Nanoarchaeota archaeon]
MRLLEKLERILEKITFGIYRASDKPYSIHRSGDYDIIEYRDWTGGKIRIPSLR